MTEPGHLAPGALRVIEGHPARTRLFREGAFWMQDEASQLVPLLFPPPWSGLTADLCAAPGGKAFVLASGAADHRILALDIHPHRLVRMREGVVRIGADCIGMAVCDSASAPPAAEGVFDRVLVDAPCSGTGVLRRHPEIRWQVRPEQIEDLVRLQSRLLDRGLEILRPGGYLVYSVCSVEPEEGEQVLEAFLHRSGCRIIDPRGHFPASARDALEPGGLLRTFPHVHASDGFFAALVQKPGSIG
jgi:16S rRNA (cytosine967-C5)-methyltransferase